MDTHISSQIPACRKIHAIPACDQGQGKENGGNNGQDTHDAVLLDFNLGLVQFPQLQEIFPEHFHMVMEALTSSGI